MTRYRKLILPITIILIAIAVQMLRAQDTTPASGNGRLSAICTKYYNLAQRHRKDKMSLVYSDSMRMQAIREKDKFAEVVSYVEPCHYYADRYDIPNLMECASKMQEVAREGGNTQFYYRAYQMMIQAHMSREDYKNAINLIGEMQRNSYKDNNLYGVWLGHKMMADVYDQMDNPTMRRQSLLEAIKFWPNVRQENVTQLYVHLAELEQDPKTRYEIMKKGEELARDRVDTIMLKNGWISYYAFVRDTVNFNRMYDKYLRNQRKPAGFSTPSKILYDAYYKLYSGDKDGAIGELTAHKDELKSRYPRYMARLYYSANDYEELYRWHMVDDSVHKATQQKIIATDIYNYSAKLHNDSLRAAMKQKDAELRLAASEKERMDAENARLNAEKEKEASERAKALAEAKQKDAELQLNRAKLRETEQKRHQAEQQREIAQMQADKAKTQAEIQRKNNWVTLLAGSFVLLIVIIAMLVTYARKAGRDLRHIELLNAQLRKAKKEAENANKIKDLFILNMTHEIRTPLNAISGFTQILTCPGLTVSDEDKTEYGTHITNNVKILTMLVDDILNISDIESGQFNVTKRATPVHNIMDSAMSVTQYRVPVGVEFKINDALPEGFTINTDGSRAQQVLVNFITNACKHTTEGSIELKAEQNAASDAVVFSVTDTGCGIPSDKAENIFERFTKLDAFKQGNGLGLYTCRIVSQKLDGHVWLDTSYTTGARFCLELPKS